MACRSWDSMLSGERIKELQINVAKSVEAGRLTVIEALARRPAYF